MNTIGMLLLAAATTGDGFGYTKPDVGGKRFLRHHAVVSGPPPAGGMMGMGAPGGAGMACGFGACFGCVVPTREGYVRLCVDGPVIVASDLESALVPGTGH